METLIFFQGMLTVIGILVVVGIVWTARQVVNAKAHLDIVERQVEESSREINLRVDAETSEIFRSIEQVYKDMDSRLDKFENRISKKQLLND